MSLNTVQGRVSCVPTQTNSLGGNLGQIYKIGLFEANLSEWELCDMISQIVPGFTFLDVPLGIVSDQRN